MTNKLASWRRWYLFCVDGIHISEFPAGTRRTNNVIMTSQRRVDVIMTSSLRRVPVDLGNCRIHDLYALYKNRTRFFIFIWSSIKIVVFTNIFPMVTKSNGNFSALLNLCEGNPPRCPSDSPHKGQWRGALMFTLICAWISGWSDNRGAGDLRRHGAHYLVHNWACRHLTRSDVIRHWYTASGPFY